MTTHNFTERRCDEIPLVAATTPVVLKLRDGTISHTTVGRADWVMRDFPTDIVAYCFTGPVTTIRTDAEILDWLERNHTLHREVRALYVVDGYQVEIVYDDSRCAGPWQGETLREAYSKAMGEWDVTHGNHDLLTEAAAAPAPPPPPPICKPGQCKWQDDAKGGSTCTTCGDWLPF